MSEVAGSDTFCRGFAVVRSGRSPGRQHRLCILLVGLVAALLMLYGGTESAEAVDPGGGGSHYAPGECTGCHNTEPQRNAVTTASLTGDWYTIDGGGGLSHGGSYQLQGSIGQLDTGTATGGSYTISGGFWPGVEVLPVEIFSDGFESGDTSQWDTVAPS